jgi:hypothetical protein
MTYSAEQLAIGEPTDVCAALSGSDIWPNGTTRNNQGEKGEICRGKNGGAASPIAYPSPFAHRMGFKDPVVGDLESALVTKASEVHLPGHGFLTSARHPTYTPPDHPAVQRSFTEYTLVQLCACGT